MINLRQILYLFFSKIQSGIDFAEKLSRFDLKKNTITNEFSFEPYSFHGKISLIKKISKYYKCNIFIETGTFFGNTTIELNNHFEKLYTCEISKELYSNAKRKFKKYRNIKSYLSNSSQFLKEILTNLDDNSRILLFLDAHYSGKQTGGKDYPCPHIDELKIIKNSKFFNKALIIIDDTRCWSTDSNDYYGWPKYEELEKESSEFKYRFNLADLYLLSNINPLF